MFGGDIALLANERCVQIGGKQVGIDKRNNLVKICHFFSWRSFNKQLAVYQKGFYNSGQKLIANNPLYMLIVAQAKRFLKVG